MKIVKIEFDRNKDAANIAKHGVSLLLGGAILQHSIGETIDMRVDYGEERFNAFGIFDRRLFVCTYTRRGGIRRIISVRKANRKEQRIWQS